MEHFIKIYKKKKGKDLRKDNRAVQKLRREVEKAKRALSNSHQVKIEVESLYDRFCTIQSRLEIVRKSVIKS